MVERVRASTGAPVAFEMRSENKNKSEHLSGRDGVSPGGGAVDEGN